MMQLLQTLLADRETERAERQANIIALQNIAQGHGNHDHPGSKLKNFQNTNPPVFSKTEEPLDADDWLQTMENNLEVAGVEANEKVLFATHYLAGPARAWWTSTRAMNGGQFMTWEDFKLKFSKYHVPPGLIKKMRDEFRELKQGRMTVVEYRDKFLTLSRYAPDETDTVEKRKERFLNGLHDEMQTVLVNIPFADLEALVDSAIQMEGKLNQANENRKRRMANQSGSSHPQKFRPSSSGGFNPRHNKPPIQNSRPGYQNRSGGNSKPGGYNPNYNNNNYNRAPPRAPNTNNTNTNTNPRTGSNAIPVANKQDKSTITCYECGVVGHYSNECPKRLAKLAGNTAAPAQQQRRVSTGKKFAPNNPNNRNGRLYHMNAEEAQEAPDVVLGVEVLPPPEGLEPGYVAVSLVPIPASGYRPSSAGVFIRTGLTITTGERVASGLIWRFGSLNCVSDNASCFADRPFPAGGSVISFGGFDVYVATVAPPRYPRQVLRCASPPPRAGSSAPASPAVVQVMMAGEELPEKNPRTRGPGLERNIDPNASGSGPKAPPPPSRLDAVRAKLSTPLTPGGDPTAVEADLEAHRQLLLKQTEELAAAKRQMEITQREYNRAHGLTPGGDEPSRAGHIRRRGRDLGAEIARDGAPSPAPSAELPVYNTPDKNMRAAKPPQKS
ncbi:hypothetical protein QYE76_034457 [Lolium multiflorum]|uniref:CCHC-type domain-containing protein n=1 Tax=Lolium multiflorum TaxID=4521 RepID=A0AAD8R0M2_LOLMU|nr:hypothetical protein QYE76_034457 [Lolium multiflorum]